MNLYTPIVKINTFHPFRPFRRTIQEMNKFHTILLDQASRTILKNITSFIKNDIKEVKEYKNLFSKVSESYDVALTRNAQANKNRSQEVTEAVNILSATTSCFRHTALDYVNMLTMLQSKKIPEILSTVSVWFFFIGFEQRLWMTGFLSMVGKKLNIKLENIYKKNSN